MIELKRRYFLSLPRPDSHTNPRTAHTIIQPIETTTSTGKTSVSLRSGMVVGINVGSDDGVKVGDSVKSGGGPYLGSTGEAVKVGGGPYFTTGS